MKIKSGPSTQICWPARVYAGALFAFFILAAFNLAFCNLCGAPSLAQSDTAFGDLEKGLVRSDEVQDYAACDRGVYSKSFDKWVKDYLSGNTAEAEKDWAGVLKAAKGANNLHRLASSTYTRLEFLEGADGEKMEKLGGPIRGVIAMYHASEHVLGISENLSSLADYVSNQFRNSSRFKEAVEWEKKALEIREKVWGKNDMRISGTLDSLAESEILTHDYAAARAHLERSLAIVNAKHSARGALRPRMLLLKLNKAKLSK